MESSVLPVGADVPSLKELREQPVQARAELSSQKLRGEPQGAQETVGPASSYGSLSASSSAKPSSPSGSVLRSAKGILKAGSVPYPEPGHSMTTQECFDALNGTGKKFYIKSRFATCSGASFTQTWFRNEKPVGQSRFVLVAKAVIAKSSRTIKVQYDYLHLDQTGTTGVSGLMISPDASIPQRWPSTATVRQGGSIPAPRSWGAIKADPDPSFEHTLTVNAGQGSGKDDTVFAVYQPEVSIKPPPSWKMGGDREGELFFLAPRWDTAPYMGKSGAAVMSYVVAMPFSTAKGAPEKEAAEHIKAAYSNPGSTKPPNDAKDIPGQTAKRPLTRLYYDDARRKANRAQSVKTCEEYWGKDYSQGGIYECDEFPFAATYQGSVQAQYELNAPKDNYSAMPIAKTDNGRGGNIISGFYRKNRIIDGSDDGFTVSVK